MGLYILRDIASTFSGDLQLNDRGDFNVSDSFDSQIGVVNFWLRTDHADYAAGIDIGVNLGEYIGENNTEETLEDMKDQTFDTLIKNIIYPEDLRVEAVPFSHEEALLVLEVKGEYLDEEGEFITVTPQVLTYTFPYIEGSVTPTS